MVGWLIEGAGSVTGGNPFKDELVRDGHSPSELPIATTKIARKFS